MCGYGPVLLLSILRFDVLRDVLVLGFSLVLVLVLALVPLSFTQLHFHLLPQKKFPLEVSRFAFSSTHIPHTHFLGFALFMFGFHALPVVATVTSHRRVL